MTLFDAAVDYVANIRGTLIKLHMGHFHLPDDVCNPTCLKMKEINYLRTKLKMVENAIKNSKSSSEK